MHRHSGFTLVEMLVSTALSLLLIALFGVIFQISTQSMQVTKAIAEADQNTRLLRHLLQSDIQSRTFRDVFAIAKGGSPIDPTRQRGYLYISENDTENDTDDVLAFTINVKDERLFGRCLILNNDPNTADDQFILQNPNQPEADDGQTNINQTSASSAGEICYFLRNGTLYRRCLLIREPLIDNSVGINAGQPTDKSGDYLVIDNYNYGSGVFWRDFDFSAFQYDGRLIFHDITESLDNSKNNPKSLGIPKTRFGFDCVTGTPREFISDGANRHFIGRFTCQETSHVEFTYPARYDLTKCPLSDSTVLTLSQTGAVYEYEGTDRQHEDMLLSGVDAFDIKVYDDHASIKAFVDIGHNTKNAFGQPLGYYNESGYGFGPIVLGNRNPTYGPNESANHVFDTWYANSTTAPPYRPVDLGIDGGPGVAFINDDALKGVDDVAEFGYPGTDDNHPLRAIQITIRFHGPDGRSHQTTIIESLIDR